MTGTPQHPEDEKSSVKMDKALDAMPYAVFTRDSCFTVQGHNKTFNRLFPRSATHHRCYQIIFGESKTTPCANCLISHALEVGKEVTREVRVTADEGNKYYRLTAVPVKNEDDIVSDAYEFIEDITARAVAEEKINQYSSHLELVTTHSVEMLRKNEVELSMMASSYHEINTAKDVDSLVAEIVNSFIKFKAFPVFYAPFDPDAGAISAITMHPATNSFALQTEGERHSKIRSENPFTLAGRSRSFSVYKTVEDIASFVESAFPDRSMLFHEELATILKDKSIFVIPLSTETSVEAVVALCMSPTHLMEHFDSLRHLAKYSALSLARHNGALRVQQAQLMTIMSLVKLMEYRDIETGMHLERLMRYTERLAQEMSEDPIYRGYVSRTYIEDVVSSCLLHDIGKVGIPDNILKKPGKLTAEEFEIMKLHTLFGGNSLLEAERKIKGQSFLKLSKEIAFCHHEWWDGSGYPYGLKAEGIPLSARIVAVVDVYDALRSKRVYKEAFSHELSCQIISSEAGSHFDENVIKAFFRCAPEMDEFSRR
ncbi:MAG TPA: HD domain-containing phosphohydrolase [Spirochaetota bacterium]